VRIDRAPGQGLVLIILRTQAVLNVAVIVIFKRYQSVGNVLEALGYCNSGIRYNHRTWIVLFQKGVAVGV